MLESLMHYANAFVTLTYAQDKVPAGNTLSPRDLTLFLKQFRKDICELEWLKELRNGSTYNGDKDAPIRIRYFAAGEYGELYGRPHYHLAVFGYPGCECGVSNRLAGTKYFSCRICQTVQRSWDRGLVDVGKLEPDSAQYIAGYIEKKMTAPDDPRLAGRHPEFARMSRMPGVGHDAMWQVASDLMKYGLADGLDVPQTLQQSKRPLMLGRYLRRKLRMMVGKDEKAPPLPVDPEMLALYLDAITDKAAPSYRQKIVESGLQKVRQLEARRKIHRPTNKGEL